MQNVLIDEHQRIKLIDFGCSQRFGALGETSEYFCGKSGTEAYMAPEILRGLEYRGPEQDMW